MITTEHGGAELAEAVKRAYAAGQDDYHLEPMVLTEDGDMCLDFIPDILAASPDDIGKKKSKKPGKAAKSGDINIVK